VSRSARCWGEKTTYAGGRQGKMLQWGISEMPRKVFRFCYSAFASISFRTGIWYADSDRHELVLRKLCANRQRTLGARGCSRRTKFDVGNLQDDGALFFHRSLKECPGR
jgi:hypothetical protein